MTSDPLAPDGTPLTFQALLSAITDPTVLLAPITDPAGHVIDFAFAASNAAFDEFLGLEPGGSVGRHLGPSQEGAGTQWLFERYADVLLTGVPLVLDNVPRMAPHLGGVRHYDLRATVVGRCVSVTFRDVSAYVEATAQLEYRALHDPLTGLYNRVWIMDMLENELHASDRSHETVAVLFIDLDNFKVINDSLGHAAGDDVLCAVAERIAGTLRARDYAARLGGDEFVVVGTDMRSATEAEALAARVTRVIQDDLEIDGHPLVLGASVGVALSRAGSTAASMLRDADSALFRAKANGRARWQFFDDTMHAAALARLTTESELRHGLAERQFVPYYQPIVGLDPRRITGYEALVRWQHPERGLLPPADFLPVAEETGLIIELGAQMLDHVCRVIATRSDIAGTISVNKSPLQINRPEWRARFLDTVKRNRADPRRLIIEVTESAVLSRIDSIADDLQALRRLGVGLHIDDFGTGYSSISLLRDLPVTGVKLDRTFTEHLADEKGARVVAAGLASLADGLDLVSIAEGIEEPEQAEILTDLGWTHGQGYLFGRPAPDLVTDLPMG